MPGVVGIIGPLPSEERCRAVDSMVESMMCETGYSAKTYDLSAVEVCAGIVAVDEVHAERSASRSDDGSVILLLAGECFCDSGSGVASSEELNDLSLIVKLYQLEGEAFVAKLSGLFSGLLVDLRRKAVLLFNDRFGIERLYIYQKGQVCYFASEAKALLRILPDLRAFDEEGVADFLALGCTTEGRTLFRGVRTVPGASCWRFENGAKYERRYFSPEEWEQQSELPPAVFEEAFSATFRAAISKYFQGDGAIGVALTGGLDSRMILACRPKARRDIVCYTFAGRGNQLLDAVVAGRVAEACGFEHHTLRLDADFFRDFPSYAERTVLATDGNLGLIGAHEIYLNEKARRLSPLRLTGNYGSEILRGVTIFKPVGLSKSLVCPDVQRAVDSRAKEFSSQTIHPITFAAFREIPLKRFGILAAGRARTIFRTPYLDNSLVALAYRAPRELANSPAPALRLIREADPVLGQIPTDMGFKATQPGGPSLGKKVFSAVTFKLDYFYTRGLPHWLGWLDPVFQRMEAGGGILGLHKFLHYRRWLRCELAGYVTEVIRNARMHQNGLWNPAFLERLCVDHMNGRRNYIREINAVVTLDIVDRMLFRNTSSRMETGMRYCASI